jgi:hypothetical protein
MHRALVFVDQAGRNLAGVTCKGAHGPGGARLQVAQMRQRRNKFGLRAGHHGRKRHVLSIMGHLITPVGLALA